MSDYQYERFSDYKARELYSILDFTSDSCRKSHYWDKGSFAPRRRMPSLRAARAGICSRARRHMPFPNVPLSITSSHILYHANSALQHIQWTVMIRITAATVTFTAHTTISQTTRSSLYRLKPHLFSPPFCNQSTNICSISSLSGFEVIRAIDPFMAPAARDLWDMVLLLRTFRVRGSCTDR